MVATPVSLEGLIALRTAKPFEPFAFVMRNGQEHHVIGALRFATNGRRAVAITPGGRSERFQLSEVASIRRLTVVEIMSGLEGDQRAARRH